MAVLCGVQGVDQIGNGVRGTVARGSGQEGSGVSVASPPQCVHCKKLWPKGSRGLCRACHARPEVRQQYDRLNLVTFPPEEACIHCRVRKAHKARRLCSACRHDPEVAAQYPPAPERVCERCHFRRIHPGCNTSVRLCKECNQGRPLPRSIAEANRLLLLVGTGPGKSSPGSPERIAVYCARVERGLSVLNPQDWKGDKE